jgi:hypothetical protein
MGAHAGQPGVERDEEVEALLLAHLAEDDAPRPRPHRLLHQVVQVISPVRLAHRRCPGW